MSTEVILVAEDREDDILLIREAFQRAGVQNPVHFVRTGEDAIAYLSGEGKYSNREEYPLPAIMLLDLKMPKVDGFEVISWARQQPSMRTLPIIVLTTSNNLADVNRAYGLGANSFFVKELDFHSTVHFSKMLAAFWLKTAKTPLILRPQRKPDGQKS